MSKRLRMDRSDTTGPKGEKRPADVIGNAVNFDRFMWDGDALEALEIVSEPDDEKPEKTEVMRIATREEPEDFGRADDGKDPNAKAGGRGRYLDQDRADPIKGRQQNRMSKNRITIEQLALACKHVDEMMSIGVSENLAIRTLEIFADVYANMAHGGSAVPHAADRVQLWSIEAKKLKDQHPNDPRGLHVRVEHGTPRRSFARDVLSLYKSGNLTDQAMISLATISWKLAVITLAEDVRLNKLARSRAASSPEERWKMAGISFDENSN